MTLSIRPEPRRHRRTLVAVSVVSAVLLLCTGASAGTPVRTGALVTALILAALPALAAVTLAVMNARNVALHRHPDGSVESVAWSGRRTTVHHPDTVRLHTIGEHNLLVIAGPEPAEPIVLVPQWWRKADLDRLTTAIHVPIDYSDDRSVPDFTSRYPRAGLPLSLRYPLAFPLTVVALSTAAVVLWVVLLARL